MTLLARLLLIAQVVLAVRVVLRLAGGVRAPRIPHVLPDRSLDGTISVVLPVLNEERRLAPCLDGLLRQGPEVAEILVVDGGSTDRTPTIVREYAARDPRLRLLDAAPVPTDWNGKAWGLQVGSQHASASTRWLLTVDADVRPEPGLARSLASYARRHALAALSAATLQRLSGPVEGLLHPALLATVVYRFGIPGRATRDVSAVQANGQCCLLRRDALARVGGFHAVSDSLCEDVTLARQLAASGYLVGLYETEGLVSVAMYESWRQTWENWPRSLPMRDRFFGLREWLGLLEMLLVQAVPLPLLVGGWLIHRGVRLVYATVLPGPAGSRARPRRGSVVPLPGRAPLARSRRVYTERERATLSSWPQTCGKGTKTPALLRINAILALMRLGVLVGLRRAYPERPWTYWLSPLVDLPAVLQVLRQALRRQHRWRGRTYTRSSTGLRVIQ